MNKIELARLDQVGRGATLKVTASNATAKSKAGADYVCDGVADEVEINAAIASLDGIGGCIELSEGTFYLQNMHRISVYPGIWLKGQGVSTILFGYDTLTSMVVDFFEEDEATGIPSKITDLCITNCSIGVSIAKFRTVYVEGCTIYGCNQSAISVLGTATVTNCEIVDNTGYGVRLSSTSSNNLIAHNRFENNTTGNIYDSSTGSIIANNVEITGGEV